MRFLRDNSLTVFFGVLFLVALVGQSIAGHHAFNDEQAAHGAATVSYPRYVVSSDFGAAMLENWQSEFLQFALFFLVTVWLVQRGSPESKPPEEIGVESKKEQQVEEHARPESPLWARVGGWRTRIYANSLILVMSAIFLGSWFGQSVTSWNEFNAEQEEHDEPTISWTGYLANADFWEKTLQNWQSEFLAVGTAAIFAVYLRQRGSPESKPVGAPHEETGTSG